ncbi:MAG: hypothetical protein M3162_08410 [Thermoproteota archaeon]|nr:hypothetical protein [Thermoproteota archaeon]
MTKKIRIEFPTVFEAVKASDLFGLGRFHNHGYVVYDVTGDQLKQLDENKILYELVTEDDWKSQKDFKFVTDATAAANKRS